MELKRGIIVSIQGYSRETTRELALEAISAGAIAIRTDKPIKIAMDKKVPLIGLSKIKVNDKEKQAYITPTIKMVEDVALWADFVAVDCRQLNADLRDVVDYCHANRVAMVADIGAWADYEALKTSGADFAYLTTALSVFRRRHWPDTRLALRLAKEEPGKIIAEGNYRSRSDVEAVLKAGVHAVCIGNAISNVYKLTRRFTTIEF
jgi:putative N-acetylmannosamine-6-phosphate epimerase